MTRQHSLRTLFSNIGHAAVAACLFVGLGAALEACHTANDDRIPHSNVFLPFTQGQWNVYGLGGAGQAKFFNKAQGIPQGFPYAAMHETGYAGILLVADYLGNIIAYSPACPVERSNQVIVDITTDDADRPVAKCPTCGSTFDIFANQGTPLSGEAHTRGFALTRYKVTSRDGYPYVVTD